MLKASSQKANPRKSDHYSRISVRRPTLNMYARIYALACACIIC